MRRKNKKALGFKVILGKYIKLRTIDILLYLTNGQVVSLGINRELKDDVILCKQENETMEIPIENVLYAELFAA